MAAPIAVNDRSGQRSSPLRVYYVPPPEMPPNAFASFWHSFHETRNEWAMKVFDQRLKLADPRVMYEILGNIQSRRTQLQVELTRLESQLAASAGAGDTAYLRALADLADVEAKFDHNNALREVAEINAQQAVDVATLNQGAQNERAAVLDRAKYGAELDKVKRSLEESARAYSATSDPNRRVEIERSATKVMDDFNRDVVQRADAGQQGALAIEISRMNVGAGSPGDVIQDIATATVGPAPLSQGGPSPGIRTTGRGGPGSASRTLQQLLLQRGQQGTPGGPGAPTTGTGTAVPGSPSSASVTKQQIAEEIARSLEEEERVRALFEQRHPDIGGIFDPLPFEQRVPKYLPAAGPWWVPDIRSKVLGARDPRAADPWGKASSRSSVKEPSQQEPVEPEVEPEPEEPTEEKAERAPRPERQEQQRAERDRRQREEAAGVLADDLTVYQGGGEAKAEGIQVQGRNMGAAGEDLDDELDEELEDDGDLALQIDQETGRSQVTKAAPAPAPRAERPVAPTGPAEGEDWGDWALTASSEDRMRAARELGEDEVAQIIPVLTDAEIAQLLSGEVDPEVRRTPRVTKLLGPVEIAETEAPPAEQEPTLGPVEVAPAPAEQPEGMDDWDTWVLTADTQEKFSVARGLPRGAKLDQLLESLTPGEKKQLLMTTPDPEIAESKAMAEDLVNAPAATRKRWGIEATVPPSAKLIPRPGPKAQVEQDARQLGEDLTQDARQFETAQKAPVGKGIPPRDDSTATERFEAGRVPGMGAPPRPADLGGQLTTGPNDALVARFESGYVPNLSVGSNLIELALYDEWKARKREEEEQARLDEEARIRREQEAEEDRRRLEDAERRRAAAAAGVQRITEDIVAPTRKEERENRQAIEEADEALEAGAPPTATVKPKKKK
jgi:hypothetical protein